jgi:hypothetical protein
VNEPFDPSQYGTEEEAKAAAEVHEANMLKALTNAYRIAADPALRKNRAGQLAQQAINNPKLTQRQKTIAENRAKRDSSISKALSLIEGTDDTHDPKLGLFNNGAQLMAYIQATGNPFEKLLAARLKPFLRDVKVVVVRDPATQLPKNQQIRDAFNGARGIYSGLTNTIYLNPAENGVTNTVALHEAVHGAVNAKLEQWLKNPKSVPAPTRQAFEDLEAIMAQAAKFYDIINSRGQADEVLQALDQVDAFDDIREVLAYGLTQPEMQDFLMNLPQVQVEPVRERLNMGAFGNFVNAIRKMFGLPPKDVSLFADLLAVTDQILSPEVIGEQAAAEGVSPAKRLTSIDKLKQKLLQSNKATQVNRDIGELLLQTRSFKDALKLLRASYDALDVGRIRLILPTLTTEDITRWVGDKVANIKNVNTAVQEMAAMRTRMIREFAEMVPEWVEFGKNNERAGQLLGDVMHASTLNQVNPTLFPDAQSAIQNDVELQELNTKLV